MGTRYNEYPQSMFWSKNKKNVYPCKPQFYYIKVGCKGVFVTRTCFHDVACAFAHFDQLLCFLASINLVVSIRERSVI